MRDSLILLALPLVVFAAISTGGCENRVLWSSASPKGSGWARRP